ncbi:cell wall anchor, partial [Bacillus cereus]
VEMKNVQIKGNIEIKKVSDTGKILPGVEFTVFTPEGKAVTKVTTNQEGIAKVNSLPFGKYYFQETKGLEGYLLNQTKYPFEVKEHNQTLTFEVKNDQVKGNVQLVKVDEDGKTNEQGIAKFDKLPAGKYTYKETLAPQGYVSHEETFSFEIKTDGEIIKHVVADQKKEVPPTPETPQPQPEQ